MRELARLRNEAARALGHRDWFALSLATDELDEGKLLETLRRGRRGRRAAPFARWKASARRARSPAASAARCRTSGPGTTPTRSSRRLPPDGAVDLDPLFEGARRRRARAPDVRRDRPRRGRRSSARSDLYPARRQEPARVLHRRRPRRRRPGARERRAERTSPRTRCCTSSATASTTSASATTCRGCSARRISSRPRPRRSSSARCAQARTGSSSSSG